MTRTADRASRRRMDGVRRAAIRRFLSLVDLAPRKGTSGKRSDDPVLADVAALKIATAVLLADRFASVAGLLERLLWESPVVIVSAPKDEVTTVVDLLEAGFRRPSGKLARGERLRASRRGIDAAARRAAAIVATATAPMSAAEARLESEARSAIRTQRTLIGVCGDGVEVLLPEILRRLCEERLVLGSFDPLMLSEAIRATTGTAPTRPPSTALASRIRPRDFELAVHPSRGADDSLARLETVTRPRLGTSDGPRLSELRGYGTAAEWGMRLAEDLKSYVRGGLRWRDIDPGTLLTGPPGTGKSLFAHALAREAGLPFMAGSLAQWQSAGEAHLGTTLKSMREFFAEASRIAPVVALIDELDSFGDRTKFDQNGRHYSIQIVNGLLECLDGGRGREGVILIGTTNHAYRIDPAILRAGRLDRCIAIPPPDPEGLRGIFRFHLAGDLADADLDEASRRAAGAVGADCASWVRRARSAARRAGRTMLLADLLDQIGAGLASPVGLDRRIAVHEGGHAIVAHALGFPVRELAIGSNEMAGEGSTRIDPVPRHGTRAVLESLLAVKLAGRCAEVLCLGAASSGAAYDLAEASRLAWEMNFELGLGSRLSSWGGRPATAAEWREVERELRRASDRAADLLRERRASLEALADLLVSKRWIGAAELEALLADRIVSASSADAPGRTGDPSSGVPAP